MNAELAELVEADQADRREGREDVRERDATRRRRAAELFEAGAVVDAVDHFRAAVLFQHGETLEDFQRAHELAVRAHQLGMAEAAPVAAAALDRWLVNQERPQKFGTQYRWDEGARRWTLGEVDPATTDEERAKWGVGPLAEAERRAAQMEPPAVIETGPVERLAVARATGLEVWVWRVDQPLGPLPAELICMRVKTEPGRPVLIAWPPDERATPRTQVLDLRGGPAVVVTGMADGRLQVALRRGATTWTVMTRLPLNQLSPILERLPG